MASSFVHKNPQKTPRFQWSRSVPFAFLRALWECDSIDQISLLRLSWLSWIIFCQRFRLWHPAMPLTMRLACSYSAWWGRGSLFSPPSESPPERWNYYRVNQKLSWCPVVSRHPLIDVGFPHRWARFVPCVYCGMGLSLGRGGGWRWSAVGQCLMGKLTVLVLLLLCSRHGAIPSHTGPGEGRDAFSTCSVGKVQNVSLLLGSDPVPSLGGEFSPHPPPLASSVQHTGCPNLPVALFL